MVHLLADRVNRCSETPNVLIRARRISSGVEHVSFQHYTRWLYARTYRLMEHNEVP